MRAANLCGLSAVARHTVVHIDMSNYVEYYGGSTSHMYGK